MKKASVLYEIEPHPMPAMSYTRKIVFLGAVVFLTFLILDLQGVNVGDDLGYMFADNALHSADGKRIETLGQIADTQVRHYFSCNGRFLVHYVVQLLVSFVPGWVESVLNALMFTALWGICCLLSYGRTHITFTQGLGVLVLLWIGLPVPGVTMLSLDAFSVNYLWVGVIIMLFVVQWLRMLTSPQILLKSVSLDWRIVIEMGLLIFAAIAGSLQESFSVPLMGAMILSMIFYHKTVRREAGVMLAGFIIGTLILLLSPGNWGRTESGGGITDALLHRVSAMLNELVGTGVPILIAMMIFGFFIGKRRGKNLICAGRADVFIYLTIIISLILDFVTFTGVRQLFFPSLLSVVMICRIGKRLVSNDRIARSFVLETFIVCGVLIFGGAYMVRYETKQRMQKVEVEIRNGNRLIPVDCSDALYNNPPLFRFLFERFDDDPFEGKYLQLLFDRYTKQGLTRRDSGVADDVTVLPCSVSRIVEVAKTSQWRENVVTPGRIDNLYGTFAVRKDEYRPAVEDASGRKVQFERIQVGDSIYYLVSMKTGTERYRMTHMPDAP